MREALIYGWVDFSGVRPGGAPRVDQRPQGGPAQRWTAPGLEVVVDPLAADVVVQDTAMALTWGRPRFEAEAGGGAADLSPARCWLRLYRRHGAAVAPMVKGPYAVAILDFAQGRGVLAVDRFARESLCYAREGTRLAFSNRADRVPLVRAPELDPQALFDYLYFHMIPAPRTVFRGVSRLPAGHALEANRDGVRLQRHWVPRFEEERPAPLRSLAEEFRRLVREAVAREADGAAVGCFLSGGTDSSTVTGMLQEVTGRPARSFSIGFDAAGYDEMAYARIAVRHFGAEHYEHYLTPEELVEGIPRVAAHYDQPFGNSSVLPAYRCARLAASAGVEKLLAGDGGDELFGGNARYATQKLFALYEAIPAPVRRRLVEPLLADSTAFARLPLVRKAAAYVRHARLPMPDRLETYNLLTRLGAEHLLAADFLASVDQAAPLAQQRAVYGASSARALVNRMLEYDWKYTLADNDLPKVLGATALAGVQAAFPVPRGRARGFFPAPAATPQGAGLEAPLLFQGGAARLPAGSHPAQEEARLRASLRRVGVAAPGPSGTGFCQPRCSGRARHGTESVFTGAGPIPSSTASRVLWGNGVDPHDAGAMAPGPRAAGARRAAGGHRLSLRQEARARFGAPLKAGLNL
ncbi:MAG: hypothetical protein KatS3mg123_3404 [Burkholderiales bacterium]|nr:MAG: hypothetical protein KatS3mg123_3404 [Burkholderiales bacterium]